MKEIFFKACIAILVLQMVQAAVPAGALTREDAEAKIAKLIVGASISKHPEYPESSVKVMFKFSDETFNFLSRKTGTVDFAIAEEYAAFDPVGDVIIPIQVLVDGAAAETLRIRAKVEVWLDVVAAAGRIDKGSTIDAADLLLEKRDVGLLSKRYLLDTKDIVGKQATVTISKGAVITDWMARVRPVVEKNEQVLIVADLNSISVSAVGIAMEDGYVGDKVRVRNKDTSREIRGSVVATGEVLVSLD